VDGRRFDSSDVNETVHVGHTGNNEMCNLYLMFYADTPTALQCHDTRLSIQSGVRAPALASAHGGVRLCMHAVCISREGKLLVTLLLNERLCASGGGGWAFGGAAQEVFPPRPLLMHTPALRPGQPQRRAGPHEPTHASTPSPLTTLHAKDALPGMGQVGCNRHNPP
jgi:hypothetical protein